MTDDGRPTAQWAPLSPAPNNRRRVWLIVGLAVAAIVIVALVLFFLLPRNDDTATTPSASPSPTSSTSESPGTPEPSPTSSGEPSPTPAPTELDPAAQRIDDQLGEALSELDAISSESPDVAVGIVGELQDAAQRLSDSLPGAGIDDAYEEVQAYSAALDRLRGALTSGGDVSAALDSARDALAELRAVVRS